MQNLERSEFDEQWKGAFDGAEVAPSASVWANVDRGLTLAENTEGKRRIVFYQRLAAASVLFAVVAGTFGVYYRRQHEASIVKLNPSKATQVNSQVNPKVTENNSSSQTQATSLDPSNEKETVKSDSEKPTEATAQLNLSAKEKNSTSQNQALIATNALNETKTNGLNSRNTISKTDAIQNQQATARSSSESKNGNAIDKLSPNAIAEKTSVLAKNNSTTEKTLERSEASWLAANVELPGLEMLPTAEIQGDPKQTEIYRRLPYIPAAFMNASNDRKFEHEKLWASVTAASGSYTESAGSSYNSTAAMKTYYNAVQVSPGLSNSYTSPSTGAVPTVGRSYSYGVIGGVRLAERWVLQTGVQYLNQQMGSSSSPYANYGSGGMISTNEFVSVPVQAGYLLVNKKIGWQLNPGVSTDFFVRNTLSNQQQSISQGAGDNSPYRSVNFAGLMSSEFSYKLGKNYRLSLVPGMRYSFNPALKSTTTGSAIAWDVGFRFRYIFK